MSTKEAKTTLTHQHLIHDNSHGPVVTDICIASLHKHLRGNVVRGANSRVGLRERERERDEIKQTIRDSNHSLYLCAVSSKSEQTSLTTEDQL